MIYIFSNAHSYSSNEEFGLRLKENFDCDINNDIIVFLNTCVPLMSNRKFFSKFINKYCICRGFSVGNIISYWGIDVVSRIRYDFNKIYCVHHSEDILTLLETNPVKDTTKEINCDYNDFYNNYVDGYVATTGFMSYYLTQQLFKCNSKDITLVNFYGSSNNSTPKDSCHKWDFEEEFFKDKNKIFI